MSQELPDGDEFSDVQRRLIAEFRAFVPPEVVQRCVEDTSARFGDAQVPAFGPVLVERIARNWLRDAVRESGHRLAGA